MESVVTELFDASNEIASSGFVKRSLTAFKDYKLPSLPISAKEMKSFKIQVENVLRSMDLDQMIDGDYVPPEEG